MEKAEIDEILKLHKMWLAGEGGSRANLFGANLAGANLFGVNLAGANLAGADLSRANLAGANLSEAFLSEAFLYRANLSGANLSRADLSGANLSRADLFGAYLSGADLSGADLSRANLAGANLSEAFLSRANLSGANLSIANLSNIQDWTVLQILVSNWGNLPKYLSIEMMRWDSILGPPDLMEKFREWKKGGNCPYAMESFSRSLYFQERRNWYVSGPPKMSLWELLIKLLNTKKVKHDFDKRE